MKKYQKMTLMMTSSSDDEPLPTFRADCRPYQWEDGAFVAPDTAFVPDPMKPPAHDMMPYMLYKLFIGDDMMDKAAYHTNLYLLVCREKCQSRQPNWNLNS